LRFIHAADVHLDSPLLGLDCYEGAPIEAIRLATRRALENLVDLAIAEHVAFVLLAGDLYDGDWRDANTGLFFVKQMNRLDQMGIPVILISGNHDAASRITGKLPHPPNVHVLPVDRPATIRIEGHRVAVHGQGYAHPAEYRNLMADYPASCPGLFNIGLLHTALEGREGHEPYAPCTLAELCAKGYDYWALGHVHRRESVNGSGHPRVEYPGNLQGRHIRETGPKGCLLVSVGADGRALPEFRSLDVFRWLVVPVGVEGAVTTVEVTDAVASALADAFAQADGQPLGVRIELTGRCPVHDALEADHEELTNQLRSLALMESAGRLWLEKVVQRTDREQPATETEPSLAEDALSEIRAVVAELRADPERIAAMLNEGECGNLFKKLPPEFRLGPDVHDPDDRLALAEYLNRAECVLGAAVRRSESP
jgi:DNA repair exonuclease SbcCD nuclease subunit